MSRLENRYRRVLRVLPAWYREAWADDMVATFLQGAVPDDPDEAELVAEYGTPDRAEVGSVLALAVRLRLGSGDAPPRSVAHGEAVRRVALVGLLLHAVTAVVGVGLLLWSLLRFPYLAVPDPAVPDPALAVVDLWSWAWTLVGLLWVAAYLALVTDHRRAAQVLAALAFVPSVAALMSDVIATGGAFAVSRSYELLFDALPVAALAAFHRDAPPVRQRPWLVAFPVGLAVVTGLTLPATAAGAVVALDWPGIVCVLVLAGAASYLAVTGRGYGRRSAAWSSAGAVLAVAALGLRVVSLLNLLRYAAPTTELHTLLAVGAVEAVAVLGAVLVLGVLARRDLRDLPPAPPAMSAGSPVGRAGQPGGPAGS